MSSTKEMCELRSSLVLDTAVSTPTKLLLALPPGAGAALVVDRRVTVACAMCFEPSAPRPAGSPPANGAWMCQKCTEHCLLGDAHYPGRQVAGSNSVMF